MKRSLLNKVVAAILIQGGIVSTIRYYHVDIRENLAEALIQLFVATIDFTWAICLLGSNK